MIIELIIALIIGILIGCLTGIIPGVHINLVASFLVAFSPFFLSIASPLSIVVFIVAMSLSHTFLDFIPSIFLGAPDEDTALSVLPGHEMLNQGNGHEALLLTLYGGLFGILATIILSPVLIFLLKNFYSTINSVMWLPLLVIIFFLLYFEKNSLFLAILIFCLSGFLGIANFNLNLADPLLPMLTGLFGISSMVLSVSKKQKIPKQKIMKIKEALPGKKSFFKSSLSSLISSPLISFLPGMGSGQAAVISSEIVGNLNRKEFLVSVGAINSFVMAFSFLIVYSINKMRTGSAAAISSILTQPKTSDLIIILATILISGIFSFFIAVQISKRFSYFLGKINYSKLNLFLILFVSLIVFLFSGFLGIIVMLVSSILGLVCILYSVRRTHLMGCILIPTLLYYVL